MNYAILKAGIATASGFVSFWQQFYDFGNEASYDNVMRKTVWNPEDVSELFLWKNNMGNRKANLAPTKQVFVSKVIKEMSTVNKLRSNFNINEYIASFGKLPAVWGTTLLHAVSGAAYPIYDQHVYRAFLFLKDLPESKMPVHNPTRYRLYFEQYVPFFNNLAVHANVTQAKTLDNALWAFGRFLSLFPGMLGS